jgi:hypothetical protein
MTRYSYEQHLNKLYTPEEAITLGKEMLPRANELLAKGRYGAALRKYDGESFEKGYRHWLNEKKFDKHRVRV